MQGQYWAVRNHNHEVSIGAPDFHQKQVLPPGGLTDASPQIGAPAFHAA